MIEEVIYRYLKSKTETPVFLELSGDYPNIKVPGDIRAFYLIEKTGSRENNFIHTSTLTIQSWGRSMYEAAKANSELKKLIKKAIKIDQITDVKIDSDYNFTDTRTKLYRYQAVVFITHYEEE